MKAFEIALIPGEQSGSNGSVTRKVVLTVDEKQVLVERVALDSAQRITSASNSWSSAYGIDPDEVTKRLHMLSVEATADEQGRRKRADEAPRPVRRVSDIANEFLTSLRPQWHRKGRGLYLEAIGREVAITELWTLASDDLVDAVADTVEGFEASKSGPLIYRARLALLKDALRMAGMRLVKELPEVEGVGHDKTVNKDNLIQAVEAFLLKLRNVRDDVGGTIQISFHSFARDVEPGAGWRQCHEFPVFARQDTDGPEVAVVGAFLADELKCKSSRKLAADLRSNDLAKTDHTIRLSTKNAQRCNGKVRRTWLISKDILTSIGEIDDA